MRDVKVISAQIDLLANEACRLLNKKEKEKFFLETKLKRTYIKGKNAGKERDVYCIDGNKFNQIWKLVYPYVYTSCSKSVYHEFLNLDDAISDVKYRLFRVLQLFGPIFNHQTLSQRLAIIVNIALTNGYNKKTRSITTESFEITNEEGEVSVMEVEDKCNNIINSLFLLDIPEHIRPIVNRLASGCSLSEVQTYFGISHSKIMKELLPVVSQLQNTCV